MSEWLTLSEAAKKLGISQTTARKWADEGKIPVHKTPGGHRRFKSIELDQAFSIKDEETAMPPGERPEVLIVDDDAEVRMLLSEIFHTEGFRTREARSAYEGIKQINKSIPDILLLDISMPGMDGLQMLQQIREKLDMDQLPVLVFSGVVDKTVLRRALRYGAQDWSSKPFNPFQLVKQAKGIIRAAKSD